VTLSTCYIAKYEVTQELWHVVIGNNSFKFKGAQRPVGKDCQEFIRKLNLQTGQCFRSPTEAEGEYAARGGMNSIGYKYAGSNNIGSVAWYKNNSGHEIRPSARSCPMN